MITYEVSQKLRQKQIALNTLLIVLNTCFSAVLKRQQVCFYEDKAPTVKHYYAKAHHYYKCAKGTRVCILIALSAYLPHKI